MKRALPWIRDLAVLAVVGAVIFVAAWGVVRAIDEGREKREESELRRRAETTIREHAITVFEDQTVEGAEEAIETMLRRFSAAGVPVPEDTLVLVVDSFTANAFAFPGDLIVLYDELFRVLETPEQVMAVLAHELGHVVADDAMNHLIQQIGIRALLALIGGREAGGVLERVMGDVVTSSFSRTLEERADTFALEALLASRVDPHALADALLALKEVSGPGLEGVLSYLDTHPAIDERIRAAQEFAEDNRASFEPLDLDWEATLANLRLAG
ncbi:MAG: M48 family metallopeptidase, partial [Spirochaetales bacterium]|nr:M48 family metallopeptidase [Spirochaetales bacterium]